MSDTRTLEEMPHEALLQELRAREAKTKGLLAASAPKQNDALRAFDNETIYRVYMPTRRASTTGTIVWI
jgi:hypothetical protein